MENKKVIYAAYGSNILKERFLIYIYGGFYRGKNYKGCNEKTDPISIGYVYVPYKLYFAKNSETWDNGGIAFLSKNEEKNSYYHSIVRLWEITENQFNKIWEQEGINLYKLLLKLGEINNKKILTFTGDYENEKNKPSESYIKVIKKGIKEITGWKDIEINKYISKFF